MSSKYSPLFFPEANASFEAKVTPEQLKLFHRIDRCLFSRFVFTLNREKNESFEVFCFLYMLEQNSYARELIAYLVKLPDSFIDMLANEIVVCLSFLYNQAYSTAFFEANTNDDHNSVIPKVMALTGGKLTLRFIHQNRQVFLEGLTKNMTYTCRRILEDLLVMPHPDLHNKEKLLALEEEKAIEEMQKLSLTTTAQQGTTSRSLSVLQETTHMPVAPQETTLKPIGREQTTFRLTGLHQVPTYIPISQQETTLRPVPPQETTHMPVAPQETTLKPIGREQTTFRSTGLHQVPTYIPISQQETTLRPAPPQETTHMPVAPQETILKPIGREQTTFRSTGLHQIPTYVPISRQETTLRPSDQQELTYRPRARQEATYRPPRARQEPTYWPISRQGATYRPIARQGAIYRQVYRPVTIAPPPAPVEEEEAVEEDEEAVMLAVTDRTVFLTFSKGYPLSEGEVRSYFTKRFGDVIEAIEMQEVQVYEQPLFAKMMLKASCASKMDEIVSSRIKNKFTINGKHVWARKYVPKNEPSTSA